MQPSQLNLENGKYLVCSVKKLYIKNVHRQLFNLKVYAFDLDYKIK